MYTTVELNSKEIIQKVIDFGALSYPSLHKMNHQYYHNLKGIQEMINRTYNLFIDEGELGFVVDDCGGQFNDDFKLPDDFFETVYFGLEKELIESEFHNYRQENSKLNHPKLYTYKGQYPKEYNVVRIFQNSDDFVDFVYWDDINENIFKIDKSHPIFEFIKPWIKQIKKEFFTILSKANPDRKKRLVNGFDRLQKLAKMCDIEMPEFIQMFEDVKAMSVLNNLSDEYKNYINLCTRIQYDQFERHTKLERLLKKDGAIIETTDSYFTIIGYETGSKFFKGLKKK